MSRRLAAIIVATALSPLNISFAAADCAGDLAEARAIADGLAVDVQLPEHLRVGEALNVNWHKLHGGSSRTPTFLVIAAPPDVRFAGHGFLALSATAKGPYGLGLALDRTRAIIPLNRPDGAAAGGQISVLPYQSGSASIDWTVITAGACGEHALRAGQQRIEVATGTPELLVRDRFSDADPLKRIRSPTGTLDLLVFKDRYAVYDVATGTKIADRAGVDPSFSPGARFVVARQGSASRGSRTEVYDIFAAKRIIATGGGVLTWVRGDSYLVYGAPEYGNVTIWNTVVDGPPLLDAGFSCHACSALDKVRLIFDLDHGYAAGIGQEFKAVDLVSGEIKPKDDDSGDRWTCPPNKSFNPKKRDKWTD